VFESDSLVESNYHDLVIKLNEEASEIEKARFHKIKNAELSRGSAQLQYKKAVFSNYVEDQSFLVSDVVNDSIIQLKVNSPRVMEIINSIVDDKNKG
jgi:phosphoribosyl-ATP pyrophosphohydrolase